MTFLNPLLLVALAAAAIPLIIHLFNFRKPQRVDFSSLAFLQELQKSTMQRVRIKQWLLLALRTLAIAALVMAFARPTMTGTLPGIGSQGRSSTAVVFDNSASMSLRDGNGAYLEQARNIGVGLAEEVQAGDEFFFLPVHGAGRLPVGLLTSDAAVEAVLEVDEGRGGPSLAEKVREAAALLEGSANPNREIHVLSDLQQSTFSDSLELPIAEDIRVFLMPVGGQEQDNIAITDVDVVSRILSPGQVVRLLARVENLGARAVSDLVVSLYLEDERVAQATVSLGAGEVAAVPISVTPRSSGWLRGRVEIQDAVFGQDDIRHLTLFIPEERNLLLVTGDGAESTYLDLALSEDMTGGRVQFVVTSVAESALSSLSLGQFDTIILNGLSDLSSGEQASVSQYVQNGGGLMFFPGDGTRPDDFNSVLAALGGGSLQPVLASDGPGSSIAIFDRVDTDHALFEGMFEADANDEPRLEQPEIFRMMPYVPGTGNEQSIIRMSGDQVFMQEIRSGAGSVVLFSVAPSAEWTDFPVRGLFVPLLFRSVYYLSSAGSVSGEHFVEGTPAQLRLTGYDEEASVEIIAPDGSQYLPDVRRVPGGLLASIEEGYLESGIYDITADGTTVRKFSVGAAAPESRLDVYPPDEAVASLSTAIGADVVAVELADAQGEQLRDRLREARTGVELWNVFLMLALACLLAEMIVEKGWRPETA